MWQVSDLACRLIEQAMAKAKAPEDLVRQQKQRLTVGSFDQCCATVLRTVQAVASGNSLAEGKSSCIFNSQCSNGGGFHWIALHLEVVRVVPPPASGDGLASPPV